MNSAELRDYYGLLGVPQTATVSEIHKAYWQRASRNHPDKGGSHEAMVRLVEAWKILSDPEKRSRYDQLLKYRHDGWRSRKFDEDVLDARKRAEGYADRSWAEFEEIYQKAFYTFNQDFYGEDTNGNTTGPCSPLMGSKSQGARSEGAAKSRWTDRVLSGVRGTMFAHIAKAVILFAAIVAALLFYRNYIGIGRYEPLEQRDANSVLMLDTTNGAVYSVESRDGKLSSSWKKTVPPVSNDIK
jgi:hypothetical protein